jgi:hypothetical protein
VYCLPGTGPTLQKQIAKELTARCAALTKLSDTQNGETMAETNTAIEEARKSLNRIQSFDPTTLAREASLGEDFNFLEAVEPAARTIRLFQQFPVDALLELPDQKIQELRNAADSFYSVLSQVMQFRPNQPNSTEIHRQMLANVLTQHAQAFNQIYHLTSAKKARVTKQKPLIGVNGLYGQPLA